MDKNKSKKIKRVLACLCALMLTFCVFPKTEIKTASALELPTGQSYEYNILPYPYYSGNITSGNFNVKINPDYSITFDGTATSTVTFLLCYRATIDLSAYKGSGGLTFSLNPQGGSESGGVFAQFVLNTSWSSRANSTNNYQMYKSFANNTTLTQAVIYVESGTVCDNFTLKPTLNLTNQTPTWTPPNSFSNWENFQVGKSEVAEQSYNEYIGGFFKNSTVNITLRDKITNSPTYIYNQTLDFEFREGYWRVNFNSICTYLSSNYSILNYNIELRIILGYSRFYSLIGYKSTLGTFSADFRYYVDRISKVEGVTSGPGTLVSLSPNYEFTNQEGYIPLTSQEVFDFDSFYIYINSLEIKTSNINDFSNLSLCDFSNPVQYDSTEGDYNSGYRDGYVKGEQDGYNEGYTTGKDIGYNEGQDVGYSEGYERGEQNGYNEGRADGYDKGLEDSGGFFNLFYSAVNVPVSVLTSMFDFEILGVNMTGFIMSIISLAILVCVVRLFI